MAASSQIVLDWFAKFPQVTTEDAYDAYWSQFIAEAQQRKIILQVLTGHHLVEAEGPGLRITDKGKEYVAWRGSLPSLGTKSDAA